jgi:hypothetical protein
LKETNKSLEGKYICYRCLLNIISPVQKDSLIRRITKLFKKKIEPDIRALMNYDDFREEIRENIMKLARDKNFPHDAFLNYVKEYVILLYSSYELESTYDFTINEFLKALEETSNYFRNDESLILPGIQNININKMASNISIIGEGFSIITFALGGGKLSVANIIAKESTGKSITEILYKATVDNISWDIKRWIATKFAIKYLEKLYSIHYQSKKSKTR